MSGYVMGLKWAQGFAFARWG